jgi:osmotically inducible protein OsmC
MSAPFRSVTIVAPIEMSEMARDVGAEPSRRGPDWTSVVVMPLRTSSARWQGNLTDGAGTISTGKGGFTSNYSFKSRFEEGEGTNPEELVAAAHASCFSMALSKALADAGHAPNSVDTAATVHLDKTDAGFTVTRIDLDTTGDVPGIDSAEFGQLAEGAKANCPISRLLSPGAEITLSAKLA